MTRANMKIRPFLLLVVWMTFWIMNVTGDGILNDDSLDNHDAGENAEYNVPRGLPEEDVQEGLNSLDKAKDIGEVATGKSETEITSRIGKLKQAAIAEKKYFLTTRMRQKEYGTSLKEAGNGIAKFTRGMKNGDWKESLSGAMDFIGGFLFLAVPWGPIASGLLSIASSILGMFFDKPPSTEEIFRKVLKEENDNIFKDNVKGVIAKYKEVHQSLSNMKERLQRENNSVEVKNIIARTVERYQVEYLTPGSELRAGFDRRKRDYCNSADNVPKCGQFLVLYLDLTSMRQMELILLSAVLQEVGNDVLAKNLNGTIKDIQRNDVWFLKFLADPYFSDPDQRKVVAMLWENRWFYDNLFKYLIKLQKLQSAKDGTMGIFLDDVMLCTDFLLMGECNLYPLTKDRRRKELSWSKAFKSAMIPPGFELFLYRGKRGKHIGRYIGPDVRSGLYFPKQADYIWARKVDMDQQNVLKQFRFCDAAENGNLPVAYKITFVNFFCDHLNYGNYEDLSRIRIGIYNFVDKIDRIQIPEGMKVTAYTERGFRGKTVGPFIGPYYSMYICEANNWASLKIEKTDEVSSSMIEISDRSPQVAPNQPGAAKLQIDICGGKGKDQKVYKALESIKAQGCPMDGMTWMRIPGDCEVIGYSKVSRRGRDYVGWKRPVGWKHIEGTWKSMGITATCAGTD